MLLRGINARDLRLAAFTLPSATGCTEVVIYSQ